MEHSHSIDATTMSGAITTLLCAGFSIVMNFLEVKGDLGIVKDLVQIGAGLMAIVVGYYTLRNLRKK